MKQAEGGFLIAGLNKMMQKKGTLEKKNITGSNYRGQERVITPSQNQNEIYPSGKPSRGTSSSLKL